LIFPETYSRVNSFKISASRGLKIFLGIAPLLVIAGFIESFITRHTDVNTGIRISVIVLSLFFILFYFVWYPWYLSKKKVFVNNITEKISYKEPTEYDFSKILSAQEILGNSFKYFNQNILSFLTITGGIAVVHVLATVLFSLFQQSTELEIDVHSFVSFFNLKSIQLHFWVGIFSLSALLMKLCTSINKLPKKNVTGNHPGFFYLLSASVISSFLVLMPFRLGIFWGIMSLLFSGPFLFMAVYKSYQERIFILTAFAGTYALLAKSWGRQYQNSIKLFVFSIVLYILLNTQVVWNYIESIFLNFKYSYEMTHLLESSVLTLITVSLMSVYVYFLVTTSVFNYYAFKEIALAESLNKRIDAFGDRDSLFGFEKEQRR